MRRLTLLVLFIFLTACINASAVNQSTGVWKLAEGRGVEVCEAYKRNLNASNPKLEAALCPRPINPAFPDFRNAEWKPEYDMPTPLSVDLHSKIDRFVWERDVNPAHYFPGPVAEWPQWRGTKEQLQNSWKRFRNVRDRSRGIPGGDRPMFAVLDIDNDGTPEPVYHDNRYCTLAFGSLLLVLSKDYTAIDRAKTERVMVHPSRETGSPVFRPVQQGERGIPPNIVKLGFTLTRDALHSAHYGVFEYKDKTYIDVWGFANPGFHRPRDAENGRLRVYIVQKDERREICAYRFRNP